jgi:hypothetical protein
LSNSNREKKGNPAKNGGEKIGHGPAPQLTPQRTLLAFQPNRREAVVGTYVLMFTFFGRRRDPLVTLGGRRPKPTAMKKKPRTGGRDGASLGSIVGTCEGRKKPSHRVVASEVLKQPAPVRLNPCRQRKSRHCRLGPDCLLHKKAINLMLGLSQSLVSRRKPSGYRP